MRREAAVLANLCLNFGFWFDYGTVFWPASPLYLSAPLAALATTALAALFFAGPALAVHRNGTGVFATVESALGRLPAHLARFCALWYLVDWVAGGLAAASHWSLPAVLKRDPENMESILFTVLLLGFLAATAHESALARFSVRLSLAVLIAAAFRVSNGAIVPGNHIDYLPRDLRRLSLAVAPMAFLASHLAISLRSTRQVLTTAALGLALPLWISVFLVGLLNLATLHSVYYQPSSGPNIAMALIGGVAASARPALFLIVAITLFGPLRLGLQTLRTTLPPSLGWLGLLAVAAIAIPNSLVPVYFHNYLLSEIPATLLACTAAVVSAGLFAPALPPRSVLPANLALLAGAVVGLHNLHEPELLLAYLTTFILALAARLSLPLAFPRSHLPPPALPW